MQIQIVQLVTKESVNLRTYKPVLKKKHHNKVTESTYQSVSTLNNKIIIYIQVIFTVILVL